MNKSIPIHKVVIVGAGLSGTLAAIFLARQGIQVELVERQTYRPNEAYSNRRSFNVTISTRGVAALQAAGIWERVRDCTLPITGRVCHGLRGTQAFPYSNDLSLQLHGARRSDVNEALIACAREFPSITFRFGHELRDLDPRSGALTITPVGGGAPETVTDADFVIGADGVFSKVRQIIHRGAPVDYAQRFLEWSYRELYIPPAEGGAAKWRMAPHVLHIWPRGDMMMFALPNPDGSFVGNFIYPISREGDFGEHGRIDALFRREFPDVAAMLGDVETPLRAVPPSYFPTQRNSKWFHGDRVVLLGDAAHATVPFYGQGMNSAFESVQELMSCLREFPSREAAFAEYQARRKPNTDAVADLSIANFEELRSTFRRAVPQARRRLDVWLHRAFPRAYTPLHVLVSHSETGYLSAIERCRRRDRLMRWCGIDLIVLALAAGQKAANAMQSLRGKATDPSSGGFAAQSVGEAPR